MAIGIIGRKAGMTRVFTEDGVSVPVTVIEVEPNRWSTHWWFAAFLHEERGDRARASRHYRRAVELEPEFLPRSNLAVALYQNGDLDEAIRLFDAILLDIDHTPTHTLHERNAHLYTPEGLAELPLRVRSFVLALVLHDAQAAVGSPGSGPLGRWWRAIASKLPQPSKPRHQWKRWRPISGRARTTPRRPKRSRCSRPRRPKRAARPWMRP